MSDLDVRSCPECGDALGQAVRDKQWFASPDNPKGIASVESTDTHYPSSDLTVRTFKPCGCEVLIRKGDMFDVECEPDEEPSHLAWGVSTYVKHVLTSRNPFVIASVYQAITGESFGRCRWYAKAHDWKSNSVLSDQERMVCQISHNCRRCGVAFSVHANGKTERWQVTR